MSPSVIELESHCRKLAVSPTIIAGADDQVADVGRQSERLHWERPSSEFIVLPGVQHCVTLRCIHQGVVARVPPTSRILPFQGEARLYHDLKVAHLAILDMAAGLHDLEPSQVPEGLIGPLDRRANGIFNAVRRRTNQLNDLVDVIRHWTAPWLRRRKDGAGCLSNQGSGRDPKRVEKLDHTSV
jgi:hypothetical protein